MIQTMMKDNENNIENGGGGDEILMRFVEEAYQKLGGERNRFFQSFDIWTQSSIQSCFHTFIQSCTISDF